MLESSQDEELSILTKYIQKGWPENKNNIPDIVDSYHKLRGELSVDQKLVFFNDRLIIPTFLRLDFIKQLHEGHLGMRKMKQLARRLYYWPQMDNDIDEFVRKCFTCQTYHNNNIKERLSPHDIPRWSFGKLGFDIMDFRSKSYLVFYDFHQ
ncbi:unnamed protein product [Parnassius mnemosyne]|uniref:RNA-directed DNA polymerase n=1 Tax=Parnassius mnemosyne TaxID=213953 RepID=A0AAV1L309_9NEOP